MSGMATRLVDLISNCDYAYSVKSQRNGRAYLMKVFLCYSQEDSEIAKVLAGRLADAGLDLWDPAETLFPGDNWALRIGEALEKSDAMIALVSPASMKSPSVRQEIEYALGSPRYKGRLLPVIVKPSKDMPWILKRFPAVRIEPDLEEAVRQIVDHIKHGFELAPANT